MLKLERAREPAPGEGVERRHGVVVPNTAGAARTATVGSQWRYVLFRWVQPLAVAAAILATEVETVGQDVAGVAETRAVDTLGPGEANAPDGGLLDEFVSLDPAAGFGNIARDSFFAESAFRSRVSTVRAPGKFGAWTVDLGDVALHINDFAVKDGFGNAVDLNGSRSGSLYQSINVKAGVRYRIRFQMSGNWTTFPGRPRALSVFFGNEKASFVMNKPASWSRTNMQWEEKTIDFVAQSDVVGLRFSSTTEGIPDGPVISQVEFLSPLTPPGALDSIPVPLPPNLAEFVQDRDKAIALGKALFWDMQVGSDGRTACASCHWHAGADVRTVNTINPGNSGPLFRGVNKALKSSDFPFHKFRDPTIPGDSTSNPVIEDRREVTGSQGVIAEDFVEVRSGSSRDEGKAVLNRTFSTEGADVRQVTGRNAPTSVNAIYFDRSFWDGRANRYFNGVNPFGELDPNARVLKANAAGELESVKIQLDNAALASQAVGPPNSDVEMSWNGRTFAALGRKMLSLQPLAQQSIAADDSVLGIYRDASGRGLDLSSAAYAKLIREAFLPEWWSGTAKTSDGYTQMEANFSMFWGLAIMMYESTLVSDQTPYDKFARGDKDALTEKAKEGLQIFVKEGKCLNCHHGPEFAGGTISTLRGVLSEDGGVSLMPMAQGLAFYDEGFYNIGVRPTTEDPGVGGAHPLFGPWSYSRQEQSGRNPDPDDVVTPDRRVAVDGAFKAPTLRNVELTGPYMHNGSMKSLTEVVQFYARGSDFHDSNLKDLDTDVSGIPSLQGNPDAIESVVEFLEHLTDPRVRYQRAPFDHPELVLPNGHLAVTAGVALDQLLLLPATGKDGGGSLTSFESVLSDGLGLEVLQMQEPPKSVAPVADAPTSPIAGETPVVPTSEVPAAVSETKSLVKTPFDAATLARKAAEKQALLGNRTSKATDQSITPEVAEIVDAEIADTAATQESVAPMTSAELVGSEGKLEPGNESVSSEADMVAGTPEAIGQPEPDVSEVAPSEEALEVPPVTESAAVSVTETLPGEELSESTATVDSTQVERDGLLEKSPPDAATLAEKAAEKDELLGDRSSPDEKEDLLGNRTSSIFDPIAIDLPGGEVATPDTDAPMTEEDAAEESEEVVPAVPEVDEEEDDADAPMTEEDAAEESEEVVPAVPELDEEADDADAPMTEEDAAEESEEVVPAVPELDEEADDADAPMTEEDAAEESEEVVPAVPELDEEADDADVPMTEEDAAEESEEVVPAVPEMDEEADDADAPMTEEDAAEESEEVVPAVPELDEEADDADAPMTEEDAADESEEVVPAVPELDEEADDADVPMTEEDAAEEAEEVVPAVPELDEEADDADVPMTEEDAAEEAEEVVPAVPEMDEEADDADVPMIEEDAAEESEEVVPAVPELDEEADDADVPMVEEAVDAPAESEVLDKAAAKDALLGNRTSPEDKDALLGDRTSPAEKGTLLENRTSSILDSIAIGPSGDEVGSPELDEPVMSEDDADSSMTEEGAAADVEVDAPEVPEADEEAGDAEAPMTEEDAAEEAEEVVPAVPELDEEADDADVPMTEEDAAEESEEIVPAVPELDEEADDADVPMTEEGAAEESEEVVPAVPELDDEADDADVPMTEEDAAEESEEVVPADPEMDEEADDADVPMTEEDAAEESEEVVPAVPELDEEADDADVPMTEEDDTADVEVDAPAVPETDEVDAPLNNEEVAAGELEEGDEATSVEVPGMPDEDGGDAVAPNSPETNTGTSPRKRALTAEQLAAKAAAKAALLGNRKSTLVESIAPNAKESGASPVSGDSVTVQPQAPAVRGSVVKTVPAKSVTAAKAAAKASLLTERTSRMATSVAPAAETEGAVIDEEVATVETIVAEPLIIETMTEGVSKASPARSSVISGKASVRSTQPQVKPATPSGQSRVNSGRGSAGSGRAKSAAYKGLTRPRGEK